MRKLIWFPLSAALCLLSTSAPAQESARCSARETKGVKDVLKTQVRMAEGCDACPAADAAEAALAQLRRAPQVKVRWGGRSWGSAPALVRAAEQQRAKCREAMKP